MPNVLLVYPEFPVSYWGFQFAMDFAGRKAFMPPLVLVAVAGMFPHDVYALRVVDMNVESLTDTHLAWADVLMTSTMLIQQESLYDVVRRCNQKRIPVVAGGPHPTSYYLDILDAYHMTIVQFCRGCPWECEWCDITKLFGRVTRTKTNEHTINEFQLEKVTSQVVAD